MRCENHCEKNNKVNKGGARREWYHLAGLLPAGGGYCERVVTVNCLQQNTDLAA
jgi:hypothetical protein